MKFIAKMMNLSTGNLEDTEFDSSDFTEDEQRLLQPALDPTGQLQPYSMGCSSITTEDNDGQTRKDQ